MNETSNSQFAFGQPRPDDAERAPLRLVAWSELTARLAAMRDFRQSLARTSALRSANFSSLADSPPRSCSALADGSADSAGNVTPVNYRARPVNRKTLADSKAAQPRTSADPNDMTSGDRELK